MYSLILLVSFCWLWSLYTWAQVKPFKHGIYWGLKKDGKIILSPKYECLDFLDSCHVQLWNQERTGIYNHCNDLWVAEIAYHKIERAPSGEWILMKDGKWGIANQKGLLYYPLAFKEKPIILNDSTYIVKLDKQYSIFSHGQLRLPYSDNGGAVDSRIRDIRPSGYKHFIKISPKVLIWFNDSPFTLKNNRLVPDRGNWYLITPYHRFPITQWQYDSSGFLQVSYYEKWGVVDFSGHIRVPLLYDQIDSQHLGTFPYQLNGKWGILDTFGNRLSFPLYEKLIPFHQFYLAKEKDLLWLINRHGKTVFSLPFSQCELLSNNYFLIKIQTPLSNQQISFLKTNHLEIPKDYAFYLINSSTMSLIKSFTDVLVFPFQDSLLLIQKDANYIVYKIKDFVPLLTTKLKPVFFHPQFHIEEKENGTLIAIRGKDTLPGTFSGFKWKEGYFVLQGPEKSLLLDSLWNCLTCEIQQSYQDFFVLGDFIWGTSSFQGYGLVDSQFQMLVKPIYDQIWEDGPYLFAKYGQCFFLFDTTGFVEIPYIGDSIRAIGCNVIAVQKTGFWKLYSIDDWNLISSGKFLEVKNCEGKVVPVLTSEGWKLLDSKHGCYLGDSSFIQVSPFYNGYTYAKTQTGWGILDTTGKWVHPPTLLGVDLLDPHYNHTFHVAIPKISISKSEENKINKKWVILDSTFQVISDDVYEAVTFLTPSGYGIMKSGKLSEHGGLLSGKCSWMCQNRPILPFVYDSVGLWNASTLIVKQGRFYGLVSIATSKVILPVSYYRIFHLTYPYFIALDKQMKWKLGKLIPGGEVHLLKLSFDYLYSYSSRYLIGQRKGKMILHDLSTGLESVISLDEVIPLSCYPYFVVKDECFFRQYDPLFLR